MKYIFFFLFIFLLACSAPTKQPEKLLSKDEMAEIIADLAIYNESYLVDSHINIEEANRFVLKKHNTNTKIFRESYQYYTYTPSYLDDIYNKAKEIIIKKEPKIKEMLINKK